MRFGAGPSIRSNSTHVCRAEEARSLPAGARKARPFQVTTIREYSRWHMIFQEKKKAYSLYSPYSVYF